MTRTPRAHDHRRAAADVLRGRIPAGFTRKAAAYAGAGLALAGLAGGVAAASLTGSAASAAAPQHKLSGAHAAAQAGHTRAHPAARTRTIQAHTVSATRTAAGSRRAANAHASTWAAVSRIVAARTYPKAAHGTLPAQDRLIPVGTSGPQSWLPMSPARYDNAKTIVRQALARHMGVRSAVIAVATSMQESTLLNLHYGSADSLGLFQQRPSMGWGSSAQILHPSYAADAFLKALHGYQARNPAWAHQPLWQAAQGVQGSAFPSAYAKWEAQAAQIVASVTKRLV